MIVNLILKKGRLSSFRSASSCDPAESNLYSLNSRYLALFPNLSVRKKTKQNKNYSITNLMTFFPHHSHDENMKGALLIPIYIIIKWWWTKNSLCFISYHCCILLCFLLSTPSWQKSVDNSTVQIVGIWNEKSIHPSNVLLLCLL